MKHTHTEVHECHQWLCGGEDSARLFIGCFFNRGTHKESALQLSIQMEIRWLGTNQETADSGSGLSCKLDVNVCMNARLQRHFLQMRTHDKKEKKEKSKSSFFLAKKDCAVTQLYTDYYFIFFSSFFPICSDSFRLENDGSWEMRYLSDRSPLKLHPVSSANKYLPICKAFNVFFFFQYSHNTKHWAHRRGERNFPKRVINFLAPQ